MKKILFVLMLLTPATLFAQSGFNGTWRFSPQSGQFSGKPMTLSLQNGVFRCDSCVAKIEVQADGRDHERAGSPYSDQVSVRALHKRTIEMISKKDGKVVRTTKYTLSPDGKTLIGEWSFVSENAQRESGKMTWTRVAAAPEGAHPASGSWRAEKLVSASEDYLTITFTATDEGLSMSDPTGTSYTAKFDGKDYPFKGDPGITSVSLKKIDANTIEETDKRDGKAILISRMKVSPDGSTLSIEDHDLLQELTSKFDAKKQ